MKKVWNDKAWEEYLYWQTQDKKTLKRINKLLTDIDRNGYNCSGKPEPLKGNLSGYWSVRIDEKNRIVFNKGNFTESEDAEVNMSTYNKLFSNFYAKEVDVYIGTKTDVTYFAGQKYFEDLSTFLDKEMYDELLSRDMIFFVQKTEYDNEEKPYLKDIPVGIIINDTAGYKNSGVVMGKDTDAIMCAASTSTNKENIKTFIKYMLE